MNKCSVNKCSNEYYTKGYCWKHYSRKRRHPDFPVEQLPPRISRICKIQNCSRKHSAKGYCRKHYSKFIIHANDRHKHKCKVRNCGKICYLDYCRFHMRKLRIGLPLDNNKNYLKGEKNHNWNGGTSQYPNHYLMKKNRLIILMQNPKCEICGNPATEVHHKDFSKTNHDLSNLMAICHSCHIKISGKHQSKYKIMYGMTLKEMKKFGHSESYYYYLHKQGRLKKFLNNT